MTSVVLVPWASTDWGEQGSLCARTPLALNETGRQQASEWANQLAGRELAAVYYGAEPTSREVAAVLAERSEVRFKKVAGLEEVDVGLWEGLTPAQMGERYPRIFKGWMANPAAVCPPDGEPIGQACDRIMAAVARIARKHKGSTVAIVLGPIAFAAVRSRIEQGKGANLHAFKTGQPVWYRIADGARQPAAVPAG